MRNKNQNNSEAGFSLVEVTIAMAIASIAMVTLLGLIPQGMETMREAGDQAIEARIHQQVLNEIQLAPFDDGAGVSVLDSYYDGLEIYYDSQGEELSDSRNQSSVSAERKQGSFSHIYSARLSLPSLIGGRFPQSVGGRNFDGYSFDGSTSNPYMRPVLIEIAAVGGRGDNFDWSDDANQKMISTFQTVVVKMGRDYVE